MGPSRVPGRAGPEGGRGASAGSRGAGSPREGRGAPAGSGGRSPRRRGASGSGRQGPEGAEGQGRRCSAVSSKPGLVVSPDAHGGQHVHCRRDWGSSHVVTALSQGLEGLQGPWTSTQPGQPRAQLSPGADPVPPDPATPPQGRPPPEATLGPVSTPSCWLPEGAGLGLQEEEEVTRLLGLQAVTVKQGPEERTRRAGPVEGLQEGLGQSPAGPRGGARGPLCSRNTSASSRPGRASQSRSLLRLQHRGLDCSGS